MTVFNSKNDGVGIPIGTSCLSQFMGPYTSMITSGILVTNHHTPHGFQSSSGHDSRLLDLECEYCSNCERFEEFPNSKMNSNSIEVSNIIQEKVEARGMCHRISILETPIKSEEAIIFLGISKILYLSDTSNGRLRKSIVSPWRNDSAFSMHSTIDLVEYATRSAMYEIFRRECKELVEIELDYLLQIADLEHDCTCSFVKFCESEIQRFCQFNSIKFDDIVDLSVYEGYNILEKFAYFLAINFFLHVIYELVGVLKGSDQ